MSTEYLILDAVVASLTIGNASTEDDNTSGLPRYAAYLQNFTAICQPQREVPIFFRGRAYYPVYANSDGLGTGCSWTDSGDNGGVGQIVFAPAHRPDAYVCVCIKFAVAKDCQTAWLEVAFNPTSMRLGHNIHPSAWIHPATGVEVVSPSSHWDAMSDDFRLGFVLLEEVAGGKLFDEETRLAIERGDIKQVRVQWAATKMVKPASVPQFLQLLTVVYDPTIARGSGIISNATHLGLDFRPHIDPENHQVTGVLFRKLHGRKPVISVSLYDKWVSLEKNHRDPRLLTDAQEETVKESVREDITVHSEGIILIAKKAQKQLESWGKEGLEFFDFLAPEDFLSQEPKSTLWWTQRSVYVLSHFRERGKFKRYSFGVWLVPYIEDDVLHFDVIAGITAHALHRMRGLRDPVAEAWRKVRVDASENWAERLAQAAKCSVATVYSRRDLWWKEIGIDIAFPPQLVIDVLHFGQASTARPENLAKMLAAVKAEDGEALLKLYTEALADFEHKRVTILNPALLERPRAMPLEGPPSGPPELDEGGGEVEDVDLMQIDLLEEGSDAEVPLASPTSSPSGVDDDGEEPEDLDFLPIDPIEGESDSGVEASRPSTFAKPKPTSPLVKPASKLAKLKLAKKSIKLKGAGLRKLGRPKPFSKS
jgi:hypothetical protein